MWFDISEDETNPSEDGSYFGIYSQHPSLIAQQIPRCQNPSPRGQNSSLRIVNPAIDFKLLPPSKINAPNYVNESPCPSGEIEFHSDEMVVSVF